MHMSPIKKYKRRNQKLDLAREENDRKYNLLQLITCELLLMGIIFVAINLYLNFWVIAFILTIGCGLCLGNLLLLKNKCNLLVCSHLLNGTCLAVIILGNFWLGEISNTYINWFFVSPIIAAATLGLNGLIRYSILSASILLLFLSFSLSPAYQMDTTHLSLINNINYIFIFLLIFTTLYNLLSDNTRYETLLREQYFQLRADKQKFHYLSNHDSLTNLPNRSNFNSQLQKIMDATDTRINSVTLYFMDLDGFKTINDQYGHEVGDILLLQTGKRLLSSFRKNDFIARLGGDEFTAIITHKHHDDIANTLMQRIINEFTVPFHIKNLEIKCSISIGMATYPKDTENADVLLKIADDKMYSNKKLNYGLKQTNI